MEELITKKEEGYLHLVNDLTKELDTYLDFSQKYDLNNYIYEHPFNNSWPIRYPGATRGGIRVDENNIITDIVLYKDSDDIYKENVRDILEKYIGMKLVVIK